MNCEDCVTMIDEYVEGELDGRHASQVSAHLMACAHCARHHEVLLSEQKLYSQYLLDVEESGVLWSNLQSEIKKTKPTRSAGLVGLNDWLAAMRGRQRLTPALAGALTLIAVFTVIGLWKFSHSREAESVTEISQNNTPSVVQVTPPAEKRHPALTKGSQGQLVSVKKNIRRNDPKPERLPSVTSVEAVVRQTELQYISAIKLLSGELAQRRTLPDQTVSAPMEKALADLDHTILEARRAVQRHPRDPVAVNYMMTAYARKVEALRQLNGS